MNKIIRLFKKYIKNIYLYIIKVLPLNFTITGIPKGCITTNEWMKKNASHYHAIYTQLFPQSISIEGDALTTDGHIHYLINSEKQRIIPERFVIQIPGGRVWGKDGIVITPDDFVIEDLCREFGKYKGKYGLEMSVFNRFSLGELNDINGKIALIAHPGANNYWHWVFDIMPRFLYLKEANIFNNIDYFLIDYTDLPFQKFCIDKLGIARDQILIPFDRWKYHIRAQELIVPSLSDTLGQTNDYSLGLLRDFFLKEKTKKIIGLKKIYISRRNAPSRKLINEPEVKQILFEEGFVEYFPEDYSIDEVADYFSDAAWIVGIHGAGFANTAFCSPGVKILEFVAPYHIDPYFYILSSRINAKYGYIFSEGHRPPEDIDLVKNKIDKDLEIDTRKLKKMIDLMK